MACFNPISLKEVLIPETGEIIEGRNVPCGKCVGCLQSQRMEWTFRLLEETKVQNISRFITLTYSDENLNVLKRKLKGLQSLKKKDLQLYFKRLRHNSPKLKYFGVGEYGSENQRPHFHAIVFNAEDQDLIDAWTVNKKDMGFVQLGDVNQASIHYLTKYVVNRELSGKGDKRKERRHILRKSRTVWFKNKANKKIMKDGRLKEFRLVSKGLGRNYADVAKDYHIKSKSFTSCFEGGQLAYLSRYLKDKIFEGNEEIKEEISDRIKQERLLFAQKEMYLPNIYNKKLSGKKAKTLKALNNSKSKVC